MPIEPIRNDADHKAALARIEAIWDAPEGSAEFYELDALTTLVEQHEERRWPLAPAEPREALRFAMDQQGFVQADLASLLGSRSRASEILSGRRSLTLDQIRLVSQRWPIPASILIGEPKRQTA